MKDTLNKRDLIILTGLNSNYSQSGIAELLKISPSAVSKRIKVLETAGLVSKTDRTSINLYHLNPAVGMLLNLVDGEMNSTGLRVHQGALEVNTNDGSKYLIRLHGLTIKYDLRAPLPQEELDRIAYFKDFPVKQIPIKNHTDYAVHFQDFTVIVRSKSVTISGLHSTEPWSVPVEEGETTILTSIQFTIENVERILQKSIPSLKLKRLARGVLSGRIISKHIAFEQHPFAKAILKRGGQLLTRDPYDKRLRLIVDQSLGFPELEAIDPSHSTEDMANLQENTKFLATVNLESLLKEILKILLENAKRQNTALEPLDLISSELSKFHLDIRENQC